MDYFRESLALTKARDREFEKTFEYKMLKQKLKDGTITEWEFRMRYKKMRGQ